MKVPELAHRVGCVQGGKETGTLMWTGLVEAWDWDLVCRDFYRMPSEGVR